MNIRTTILLVFTCIFKLSAQNLNFEWVNPYGSISDDQANSIKVDNFGNIYTTGIFTGTVDFDPGSGVINLTSAGLQDIFITKVNSSGTLVWARSCGGSDLDEPRDIDFDASGNVYITGYFLSTADFDPGAGTFNLSPAGSTDAFVLKLNSSGNFVNAIRIGGTGTDLATGIKVDNAGDIIYTGRFENTVDFDPGVGTQNLATAGGFDIFVTKVNSSLNYVWAQRMGGPGFDGAFSVVVDGSGNVYTTGYFGSTADFDPGAGIANLVSAGQSDIFVSRLTSSGLYSWASAIGGLGDDYGYGIAIDVASGVYVTGQFASTIDADPGVGTFNLSSSGATDVFLIKLNLSGTYNWAKSWGGTGNDAGLSVATDGPGNIWTSGSFSNTVDFDPNAGTIYFASAGGTDAFCSKINSSGNLLLAKKWGSIGSDFSRSIKINVLNNVYNAGAFTGTTDFDPNFGTFNSTVVGGTDAYTLKFDLCNNTSSIISPVVCETYTSPSGTETYTASGSYLDTIANARGCDSIININLTILNNTNSSINPISCNSYISPSNLYTYTSSGIYYDTIPNFNGCDSIIQVNLTIDNSDTTISINNGMYLVAQAGATYQWFDCTLQAPISGETNQTFTPTLNGSYAVILNYNACIDTTGCQSIFNVGMEDLQAFNLSLYPNPSKDYIIISGANEIQSYTITDLSGRAILKKEQVNSTNFQLDISTLSQGNYLIEMHDCKNKMIKKFIKIN